MGYFAIKKSILSDDVVFELLCDVVVPKRTVCFSAAES